MLGYCDWRLYRKLYDRCNPREYIGWIVNDVIPSLEDEDDRETALEWIRCVESFIKRYIKFASGCMADDEIYRFYNDVLKMIDEGIDARKFQRDVVVGEELSEATDLYYDGVITEDEYNDIKKIAEYTREALDEDIEKLYELKRFCIGAKNKYDAIVCIEKVANTMHTRGHMLPVMCGAYLEEYIVDNVLGREREFTTLGDIGVLLSEDVAYVFECIAKFVG